MSKAPSPKGRDATPPPRAELASPRPPVGDAGTVPDRLALLDRMPTLDYPEAARLRAEAASLLPGAALNTAPTPVLLFGTRDNGRSTLARQFVANSDHRGGRRATVTTLPRLVRSGFARLRPSVDADGPGLVVVDDCDALADATARDLGIVLRRFRAAADAGVATVAVGDGRLASRLLSEADRHGAVRRLYLPRWSTGSDWLALLRDAEALLPLREPSHLSGGDLAGRLHALSDGRLGSLSRVLRAAAAAAILSGVERISVDLLDDLGFEVAPRVARHRS